MDINNPIKRRRIREDRRRTARACDRCRRLKERCDGGIPCTRCTQLRRHCEFKCRLPSPAAAAQSQEVNVRELLERVTYLEKILQHKVDGIALDVDSLRRMARALDEHEQNKIRAANSPPEDEDPIEEEVCTIDPVEDTTTHYSGEFSYWNFSMRVKRHIEHRMEPQVPFPVCNSSNYWRAQQLHSGVGTIAAARACCPPRQVADFLVNVFFKHVETYYFYVDRAWLEERIDELYYDPGKFNRKSAAVVSIILTVFAIATQYAYLDSPTKRTPNGSATEFSEDALGTMFYEQAIRFLPEIIEASSLESVQACLLFSVYALPVDASGLGYIYITLTTRLGMQNGMHRQYRGTGLSAAMIETRNRVWWTAYTLERKIAIFHGRPLSTHRVDVDANPPTNPENASVDSPPTTLYMVASIILTRRLEEFSHDMSLLRTCQKHERSGILSRLVTGKKELDAWWETLPDEMRIETPLHRPSSRITKHLQLEYGLVRMFIGRPLLLNRLSTRSTPTSPEDTENRSASSSTSPNHAEASHSSHVESRQELIDCCIQGAQEALRLCRSLRDTKPGLARSSYIEYSSCRASLLALIAHSIHDQSTRFRTELRDGLDMIREMAAAGDSARSEVALLESLEGALTLLQYSSETGDSSGKQDLSSENIHSGYEGFKYWETQFKSVGTANVPATATGMPVGQEPTLPEGHQMQRIQGDSSGKQDLSSENIHSGYEGFKYWETQFKSVGTANVPATATGMPVGQEPTLPEGHQMQRIQGEDSSFGFLPRGLPGYLTAPVLGSNTLEGHSGPVAEFEEYCGIFPSSQDILHPDFWH